MAKPIVAKKEYINWSKTVNYIHPFDFKLRTIPTPNAIARAERIASIPLDKPESESPDIVSLIEFVIETPGTKYIIEPIIILSKFSPSPNLTAKIANREERKAPINLSIKNVRLNFDSLSNITSEIRLAIKLGIKSWGDPPYIRLKNPDT